MSEIGRDMRADAAANREAIVTTAMSLFADVGVDVSLRTVAAQAGVGIGTLYRHFPSRDDLVHGVAVHVVGLIDEVVARYDARHDDEAAAWRAFVGDLVALRLGRLMPQLAQFALATSKEAWALDLRGQALARVDRALARAKAAGLVRQDVEAAYFQVAIAQLSRPLPDAADELIPGWDDWSVDVVLRGLKP